MKQPPPPEGRRPYKVFVSSTYLDNQERRKFVEDAFAMAGMGWHGVHYGHAQKSLSILHTRAEHVEWGQNGVRLRYLGIDWPLLCE